MSDETVVGHAITKRQQAAARQTLRRVRGARGRARSWEREALNVQGSTLNVQRSTFKFVGKGWVERGTDTVFCRARCWWVDQAGRIRAAITTSFRQ
jgi:hypothetical protein